MGVWVTLPIRPFESILERYHDGFDLVAAIVGLPSGAMAVLARSKRRSRKSIAHRAVRCPRSAGR